MFENTGGSAAYVKYLEDLQNTPTENVPIDEKHPDHSEGTCEITIAPAPFEPKSHFAIRVADTGGPKGGSVFEGEGYGLATGFKPTSFSGRITLRWPPGWDGLIKAKDVKFKSVKAPAGYMNWGVYIGTDTEPVMCFGGQVPVDPALVNSSGPMSW